MPRWIIMWATAFWLFPPPFVHNASLPMLAVIGAI
jgi:hypothetical protein